MQKYEKISKPKHLRKNYYLFSYLCRHQLITTNTNIIITMKEKITYRAPETEISTISAQGIFMGSGNTGEDYTPKPLELGNGLDQFPKFF